MRVGDDSLRSARFRREREADWRRLEELLAQVERRSPRSLSDEDMVAIPALYRAALSSLSVARATSLDAALIEYLEALCARAYFFVYGARSTLLQRVSAFFSHDWPRAIQGLWRETLAATLLLVAGILAGYFMTAQDPEWYATFVGEMAQGRTPTASTEELRATIYAEEDENTMLSVFATFLFTNNATVSIVCFALGFAFGVPTAMLLVREGCRLGAMVWLFDSHELGVEFVGWILIHGVTEFFAIILAAAAGMRIGWAIAFPGALSRLAAAEQAGRQGGVAMIGVLIMLFTAGLIEGFARQLITLDWVRYSFAAATALLWGAYFYFPRKRPAHG